MSKAKRKLLRFEFDRRELMKNSEERIAWQKLAEELEDDAIRNANSVRGLFNGENQRRFDEVMKQLYDMGVFDLSPLSNF
jgi:predicted transcriptional regulator YheO